MTPKHILALSALLFVLLLGVVGVIDATEPGHTLDAIEVPALAAALAGLSAGGLGVVLANRARKRDKPDDSHSDDTATNPRD